MILEKKLWQNWVTSSLWKSGTLNNINEKTLFELNAMKRDCKALNLELHDTMPGVFCWGFPYILRYVYKKQKHSKLKNIVLRY